MAKAASKTAKKNHDKSNVKVKVTREEPKKSKARASKASILREKQTRLEILQTLAEKTDLPKVQVEKLFLELVKLMEGHLRKKGSGEFTIPFTGVKLKRVKKKASKARKMVSPLIGEEVEIPAKPARNSVKVTVLKVLKDMVDK